MEDLMDQFTFFWLDGKAQVLKGINAQDALTNAGYGAGAVKALDFWTNGDSTTNYRWDSEKKTWKQIP